MTPDVPFSAPGAEYSMEMCLAEPATSGACKPQGPRGTKPSFAHHKVHTK